MSEPTSPGPTGARSRTALTAGLTALVLAASGCATIQAPAAYAIDPRLDFPVFTRTSSAAPQERERDHRDAVAAHDADATRPRHLVADGFGLAAHGAHASDADATDADAITLANGEVLRADAAQPTGEPDVGPRWRKASPALFWTGIALGSFGGALLVGGGITGAASQRQVRNAYDDGATKAEIDRLVARGEVANDLVITGSVLALAGYALAVVVAGIDEKRCGAVLRKARRRECESR